MKTNLQPIFSGVQPFSTIDDFGHLSAVFFTGGCNFRCPYCHNPDFVIPEKITYVPLDDIITFLKKRKKTLDSIVICGGEPTLHPSLLEWLKYIKSLGYRIKLDTNGTNPKMIQNILEEGLVDFFAIDYKAPIHQYEKIARKKVHIENLKESFTKIINSGIDYEFRSTIHPSLHSKEDVLTMIKELKELNAKRYYLQLFLMPKETVGEISDCNFEQKLIDELKMILESQFEKTGIRNN